MDASLCMKIYVSSLVQTRAGSFPKLCKANCELSGGQQVSITVSPALWKKSQFWLLQLICESVLEPKKSSSSILGNKCKQHKSYNSRPGWKIFLLYLLWVFMFRCCLEWAAMWVISNSRYHGKNTENLALRHLGDGAARDCLCVCLCLCKYLLSRWMFLN